MPDFTPTEEQVSIVSAARETSDNLAVIARAGAAKTSTLILIAEALPETDILCLAFNKAIATEMQERLPPNCEAKTLHGLGYKAWWQFIRKPCKVDDGKIYNLLRAQIERLQDDDRKDAYESMAETLDFIRQGKNAGYLPDNFKGHWKPLLSDEDFFEALPMEPSFLQIQLIKDVSAASFRLALDGQLDFADMILCPALCAVPWPTPSLTLVDEAQDLSALNHHMLKKIVKNRRLIAVGDPCQAIYGFRGADTQSISNMQKKFDTQELKLTISFRCAKEITKNARWRAPDMRSPEWATQGEVRRPLEWSADALCDGDAIICRNNAPLFRMAIRLIIAGRLPEIAGKDIGKSIMKLMKKLGRDNLERLAALDAVDEWEQKELNRARDGAKAVIHDQAEIMRIMIEKTDDLGAAKAYLQHLLQRDGRIYLMTGHKSKGLEFDNVWFLDQHLCQIKHDQDANIKYVIETRAKESLTYVSSDSFSEGEA